MELRHIRINKNRGWRGLSEVLCVNDKGETALKMIFSFSQPVWNDMLRGVMVLQDEKNYHIVHFDHTEALPHPDQQRSVLIKNFTGRVTEVVSFPKDSWIDITRGTDDYDFIYHFTKNRNNHTTSDWNCIGIRVIPTI